MPRFALLAGANRPLQEHNSWSRLLLFHTAQFSSSLLLEDLSQNHPRVGGLLQNHLQHLYAPVLYLRPLPPTCFTSHSASSKQGHCQVKPYNLCSLNGSCEVPFSSSTSIFQATLSRAIMGNILGDLKVYTQLVYDCRTLAKCQCRPEMIDRLTSVQGTSTRPRLHARLHSSNVWDVTIAFAKEPAEQKEELQASRSS